MTVLTFPLSLADFFFQLPISNYALDLPEALDVAETGAGEILTADIGVQLWGGQIDIDFMLHDEVSTIRPLINILRRAGSSFLVSDPTRPWPRFDPEGALLAGSAPTISGFGPTSREVSFSGLPAGYPLARGDLFSFTYGSARYALHELVGDAMANAVGETPLVEINPPLRPGALTGAPVRLVWPCAKARLVPGSASLGQTRNTVTTEVSFRWSQTLR